MTRWCAGDQESPAAQCADSEWVDAEFAAIIAANWPAADDTALILQRLRVALAARADRHDAEDRQRFIEYRVGRPQSHPVDRRWARERSPPAHPDRPTSISR